MATHKEDGIEAMATMHQDMESLKLTFAALDARIEALPEYPPDQTIFLKKAQWGFALGVTGGLFALLCVNVLPGNAVYTAVLIAIGVAVETIGVILAAISQIPKK